ncbi:protein NUCLEAR FUSION DEFECTIVE 6, mitochondrial [Juglans microcarpa x Juglans regia]|uniref:protein NUCLEAR FUSION DEFECTIVE 6, mitochondrial n=1 Tax=Juglans microcarpa x Juglans regia TaxID=2249226 RepID=UPI001B7F1946|nr:protein NUCLEAR FUSION DEFECTIVE 6, mitochondrial [Juglans microcarpa x Juglans regia]
MAANCARRTLLISSASAKALLSRTSSSSSPLAAKASKLTGGLAVEKRVLSRLPVELTGVQQSLMPLHSVTASALFTSLLSLHNHNWGCLSEGFATPL